MLFGDTSRVYSSYTKESSRMECRRFLCWKAQDGGMVWACVRSARRLWRNVDLITGRFFATISAGRRLNLCTHRRRAQTGNLCYIASPIDGLL